MEDEIQYPGLVGAGISRAQKSPYDRSFEPGEATLEDVRASLVDMFLSGLGLVPGGALAASSPRVAGGRTRDMSQEARQRRIAGTPFERKALRARAERVGASVPSPRMSYNSALNDPRRPINVSPEQWIELRSK